MKRLTRETLVLYLPAQKTAQILGAAGVSFIFICQSQVLQIRGRAVTLDQISVNDSKTTPNRIRRFESKLPQEENPC